VRIAAGARGEGKKRLGRRNRKKSPKQARGKKTIVLLFFGMLKTRPALVLDLDHTLVHCIETFPEHDWKSDPEWHTLQIASYRPEAVNEHGVPLCAYFKLRPHARTFLRAMSQVFTLYVYSMGERGYVDAIVNVLDPQARWIARHRICSRTEQDDRIIKRFALLNQQLQQRQQEHGATDTNDSLLHTNNTLILDDNYDVWGDEYLTSVLHVPAFHVSPDPHHTVRALRGRDDVLVTRILPIMLNAAAHYRAASSPLSTWLPLQRAQVLQGCRIMFFTDMDSYRELRDSQASPEVREHLFQSNQSLRQTQIYMHWATRFGAECFYSTTHQMPIFRDSILSPFTTTPTPDVCHSMHLSRLDSTSSSSSSSSPPLSSLPTVSEATYNISCSSDTDLDIELVSLSSSSSFSSWTTDSMVASIDPVDYPLSSMTHMVYHSLSHVSVTTEFLQLFQAGSLHLVNDFWIRDTCLYMQRQPEASYLAHPTHASRLDRDIHIQGVHI
jgi:hypothetical protein